MFTDIGSAHGHDEDVEAWAEETIGDTHLGKRKTKIGPEMRKGKKTRTEEEFGSDETTPEPSGGEEIGHDDDDDDSSSSEGDGNDGSDGDANDGDDGNDSGGSDGDEGGGADTSGYYIAPTIMFTGEEDFTYATQDTDYGAPTSSVWLMESCYIGSDQIETTLSIVYTSSNLFDYFSSQSKCHEENAFVLACKL